MTSSAAWELSFGLIAILLIFFFTSIGRRAVVMAALLVMIPFQFIDTKYGTSSEIMAYTMAGVMVLTQGLRLRMLPEMGLIILAYLASFALADRDMTTFHLVFMFEFFSCFIVFILAYNFALSIESTKSVMDVLLAINVLIVLYCGLQLIAGPGEAFTPFGIETFAFNSNRDPSDPRLVGPFGNPGTTAGYFTLMLYACAVELMFAEGRRRRLVQGLIAVNLLGLVATGNRTGFLILVAMFPVFLFVFKRQLGPRRITQYVLGGVVTAVIVSAVAVVYTDFGSMFERLSKVTETEAGVPTTRAETWPIAIEKIKERPWFGEGPHFLTAEDAEAMNQMRIEFEELGKLETVFDPYPHSLYLYLLRTVGIFGLIAVVWYFVQAWRILRAGVRRVVVDDYSAALVRLGIVLIPAFLIAQITLEFSRPDTMDYGQFIFGLIGMLIGTSDRLWSASAAKTAQDAFVATPQTVGH
jgi:O-antigen ligase